jgi:signal transduction histidine kinase
MLEGVPTIKPSFYNLLMNAFLRMLRGDIWWAQLIVFIIFSLSSTCLQAQTIESLNAELEILRQNQGFEKDTIYLNKANELGFILAESNPEEAFPFLDKQIEMCRKAKFEKGESEALKIYGNALQNKGDFTASIGYYQKALSLAEGLPHGNLVPGILNNIGLVYFNQGNYAEALKNFYDAIKGAENTKNLNVKAAALNNIALIYFEQDKFEDAKSKYREMLDIYKLLGNQGRMILALNNIGDVELKQNRPFDALENLKLGHSMALELQSSEFIEMTSRTLADIFTALDSVDKAEILYKQSISISQEKGYGVPLSHSTIGLADLYLKKGKIKEALVLANEGLAQSEKMGQIMQLRNSNELLAKIYEKNGDFAEALEKFKLFKQYSDSVNNTQGQRLAATLEAEYEFSKKTLEFEKANLRQKWLIFSAFFGLFAFLIILFLVYRNRNKLNKAFLILKEKNIEIGSKNEKLVNALSQLKATQLQLIQSEKMASLGELTAGIAHEMRNPINFVNNFSEVSCELIGEIQEERAKNQEARDETLITEILEDVKSNLEKITHHGKRVDDIVKGMLEHSQKSSGEKELTDMNALCTEYLRLSFHGMKGMGKDFNVTYETNLDPRLPKVNVIPQDIGRVLLNIINNAFQALTQSSKDIEPHLTVSTKNFGDHIQISISDNGPGIPEVIKDKIFQPFFTTKPAGQGTGLGLSLSYDIIKAHGGEIMVESRVGVGSEFVITIPKEA